MEVDEVEAGSARTLFAKARGRVQNVGFRVFIQGVAQRLGIRGYTRNASDGSVEVVAAGDRKSLEQLLSQLRRGPVAARVDAVEHRWLEREPEGLSGGFEVRS